MSDFLKRFPRNWISSLTLAVEMVKTVFVSLYGNHYTVSIIMIIYAGLLSVVEFSYLVIASCTPHILGCCSYSLHDCL